MGQQRAKERERERDREENDCIFSLPWSSTTSPVDDLGSFVFDIVRFADINWKRLKETAKGGWRREWI